MEQPSPVRDRKRDPYTCAGCGARFEVTYFDDRAESVPVLHDVACPRCTHAKGVMLPQAAERTLQVELDDTDAEADEGAGD
jgi:DNA-directed RNA polymerase subunit RPC12/RpoP